MIILHIETSTNVCSVAVSDNLNCIFSISNDEGMNHAALLHVFIEEALQKIEEIGAKLNAIAVSSGPGSYTGLRIGVSTAKGMCYGLDIPLIEISTLEIMTIAAIKNTEQINETLFCPMIDARRMEVYCAFYNSDLKTIRVIKADIINSESFIDQLDYSNVIFFGNGSDKCKEMLTHRNAKFINNIVPLAENMIRIAVNKFNLKQFVDVAYFEPFYLKEFQTTIPKK